MQEEQQKTIEDAKQILQKLFAHHERDGIIALYIWGSITRSDFDPATSDIDVLCIVDDTFPAKHNELFKQELTDMSPGREWGFQVIYLDELNGGEIRSRLAQAMSPQSILPSFPSWIYVCGTRFERSDFAARDATIPERMRLNIQEIRTRLSNIPTDDDARKLRDRKGMVKACLQLIYNRQLLRNGYFDLDYNVLPIKADAFERTMVEDLLKVKQQSLYDEVNYEPYARKIQQFAMSVERELAA